MPPTIDEELALRGAGYGCVAGLDEVGRGCWAGPVVAAAVVLGPKVLGNPALLGGVDDSKLLAPYQRELLDQAIRARVQGVGLGVVPVFLVDGLGIAAATRLAMLLALLALPVVPDALLIDAVHLPLPQITQRVLVRGDQRCLSIAAASVVAKVARDQSMRLLDACLPGYGFGAHKGYGTAAHYTALRSLGPSTQHRRSFRPVAEFLVTGHWPARAIRKGSNDAG